MPSYGNGRRLLGVLYLHHIADQKMGGIATKDFKMLRMLCGEHTLRNATVLTSMRGEIDRVVGEAQELELGTRNYFSRPVLDKGANLFRHTQTVESACNVFRYMKYRHKLNSWRT
ncbi:hypothetical protein BD779DRAFT_1433581 [Infundibulicybe gibba]|nr:hypothetical protein BD779DRAFT_1433581 [Infundibulicybe gibba]